MEQYTLYKSCYPLNVTTAGLLVTRKEAENGTAQQTKNPGLGIKTREGLFPVREQNHSLAEGSCK